MQELARISSSFRGNNQLISSDQTVIKNLRNQPPMLNYFNRNVAHVIIEIILIIKCLSVLVARLIKR